MRVTQYYLVRGNPGLIAKVAENDSFWVLARPLLLASPEGGKSLTAPSEYLARAKLFTLIHFRKEYSDSSDASGSDVVAFLKSEAVSEAFFDRWWEITTIESEENIPEVGKPYKAPAGLPREAVISPESVMVKDWLGRAIEF